MDAKHCDTHAPSGHSPNSGSTSRDLCNQPHDAQEQDICNTYGDGSHTLMARVVLGKHSVIGTRSCALVAFTDMTCQDDGSIVRVLRRDENA